MPWIERLARRGVPSRATFGARLHREGAVRIESRTASGVRAEVRGAHTAPDVVGLEWIASAMPGRLRCACSCADFAGGFTCKHIWAVLYALDAEPAPAELAGPRAWIFVRSPDLRPAAAARTADPITAPTPTPVIEPEPPAPAEPRTWKETLEAMRTQSDTAAVPSSDAEPEDELPTDVDPVWYVLDVPASRAVGLLTVQVYVRRRRRDDSFEMRAARPGSGLIRELRDAEDREIVAALIGAQPAQERAAVLASPRDQIGFRIDPSLVGTLLPRLVATGRVALRRDATQIEPDCERPLVWEDGDPWSFQLEVVPQQGGKSYRLAGAFGRGEQQIDVAAPLLVLAPHFVVARTGLARLDAAATRAFEWIELLRDRDPLVIPSAERDRFVEALARVPGLPSVIWPEDFAWNSKSAVPRGRLELTLPPAASTAAVPATLRFEYDGAIADAGNRDAAVIDAAARTWQRRDFDHERALATELRLHGALRADDEGGWRIPRRELGTVVAGLAAAGWTVRANGHHVRTPAAWKFTVASGIDWFDLDAECDYDGVPLALPRLLRAARRGDSFVALGDGSVGMLPEDWLARFAPVLEWADSRGEHVRFATAQATVLDALLAAQECAVDVDAQFAALRQRLHRFEGVVSRSAPPGFIGELRGYQQMGLGWLAFLREFGVGGCLADDMGLGKTVQVLALLEEVRSEQTGRASLVVVPRSLVHNWISEAARFTPNLRVLDYTGTDRRARAGDFSGVDLAVTTYGTLRRDITRLREVDFEYAILDEAQAIKNAQSLSAKASRLLRARHRLALTGTPVENRIEELWSLFEFLNPGMLGRVTSLRGLRLGPGGDAAAIDWLVQALRPYLLRRTKERVLAELPPKTEQTLHCEMDRKQRRLYDELRDHYRSTLGRRIDTWGLARSKMHVLEALLRLRQAACHPGLVDPKRVQESSAKLDTLLSQLEEVLAEGHKALVFSQFTQMLAIVRRELDARGIVYEYLDGRTRDRAERVARFQDDAECPIFLVSLKAGGQGLNLTAADYVFLLDPWWNPAVETQAIDRTHRIGQTRRVFAYRLLCKDTVEDKIAALQARKRDLATSVLGEDAGFLRRLTADDLRMLLD